MSYFKNIFILGLLAFFLPLFLPVIAQAQQSPVASGQPCAGNINCNTQQGQVCLSSGYCGLANSSQYTTVPQVLANLPTADQSCVADDWDLGDVTACEAAFIAQAQALGYSATCSYNALALPGNPSLYIPSCLITGDGLLGPLTGLNYESTPYVEPDAVVGPSISQTEWYILINGGTAPENSGTPYVSTPSTPVVQPTSPSSPTVPQVTTPSTPNPNSVSTPAQAEQATINDIYNSSGIRQVSQNYLANYLQAVGLSSSTITGTAPTSVASSFPATITVTVDTLYVRSAPNTAASLAGSQILSAGATFTATSEVTGENIDGNDIWYISSLGNYVWSGGTSTPGGTTPTTPVNVTPVTTTPNSPVTTPTSPSTPQQAPINSSTASGQPCAGNINCNTQQGQVCLSSGYCGLANSSQYTTVPQVLANLPTADQSCVADDWDLGDVTACEAAFIAQAQALGYSATCSYNALALPGNPSLYIPSCLITGDGLLGPLTGLNYESTPYVEPDAVVGPSISQTEWYILINGGTAPENSGTPYVSTPSTPVVQPTSPSTIVNADVVSQNSVPAQTIMLPAVQVSNPPANSTTVLASKYANTIGVYHWSNQDAGGGKDPVADGVAFAAEQGFKIVRLALSPRSGEDYGTSSSCDTNSTLAQIAAEPTFAAAFSNPSVTTYLLTTYDHATFSNCSTKNYFSASYVQNNKAAISAEYQNLATYLGSTYPTKKFIILNWEGDNDLYCGQAYGYATNAATKAQCDTSYPSLYVGDQNVAAAVTGMAAWFSARDAGIQAAGQGNVSSGMEVNIVNALAAAGDASVLNNVLPLVNPVPQYLSYSSYESINQANPAAALTTDLATIRKASRGATVIIGEYGYNSDTGLATAQANLKSVSDAIVADNVPYGIIWQLFNQPGSDFGLFNNSSQPVLFPAISNQ